MDQELHKELRDLHTSLALVVQRTAGLPNALEKLDARVTELEDARKKAKYMFAGGMSAVNACWVVAYFVFKELFK